MQPGLNVRIGFALALIALGKAPNRAVDSGFQQPRAAISVVGSWELVSLVSVRPNGEEVTDWMGPKPRGLLMYQSDGYMSVHVAHDPPGRWSSSAEQATVEERAMNFDRYYAYFGRYDIDEARGIVRHLIQGSLLPQEVGVTYERRFTLDGDRLSLVTAEPDIVNGERRFNRLVWKRAK